MADLPRTCRTCQHWSPYLHDLGECLEYVTRRQDAWEKADDTVAFHTAWPRKAAVDRRGCESCDKHELAAVGRA